MDDYWNSKRQRSSPLLPGSPLTPTRRRGFSYIWARFRMVAIVLLCMNVFFNVFYVLGGHHRRESFQDEASFPKKIWQSWKVDPLRFDDRDLERARSWTVKNPRYRYEVLTDDNAEDYVDMHFGFSGIERPDLVATYKAMNSPNTRIIQADLLRYMILYIEGGVWADIDVEALKPVDSFIPKTFDERNINMIIGVETDEPEFANHPFLGAKAQSFVQWTFAAKPRQPVMLRLVEDISIWVNRLAEEQGCEIRDLQLDFDTVLVGTGPSAFTKAILDEMSTVSHVPITWDAFHNMDESRVVGNILVLPSEAFAAGTGHSDSGNHAAHRALVKHHFHASSWTTHHARYRHPIYDEVERCNWDVECVKLWDANTAWYDSLPEEEQLRMIEMKNFEQAPMDQEPEAAMAPEVVKLDGNAVPPPAGAGLDQKLGGGELPKKDAGEDKTEIVGDASTKNEGTEEKNKDALVKRDGEVS